MLGRFGNAQPQPVPVPVQQQPYGQYQAYGYQQQAPQQPYAPYGAYQPQAPQQAVAAPGRMTLDDVITKAAICLGLVVVVAAATFMLLPLETVSPVVVGFSLATGIAAFVISMQKTVSPVMAIGYAVAEGVSVGAISKVFEYVYPGIIGQAVLGTFLAAGAVLAFVKAFNIQVGAKARRVFMLTAMAYAAAMLLNFLLNLAGINLGFVDQFGDFSLLGALFCLIGTALAVFSLVTDFDDINRGIQAGAPASESWRAAFGLTFSLVWLYLQLLRILSYLRD